MNNIGRTIYGFCNGYFGRDHYHDARIEAEGFDWIVVRNTDGGESEFATFLDSENKQRYINEWAKKPKEDV